MYDFLLNVAKERLDLDVLHVVLHRYEFSKCQFFFTHIFLPDLILLTINYYSSTSNIHLTSISDVSCFFYLMILIICEKKCDLLMKEVNLKS